MAGSNIYCMVDAKRTSYRGQGQAKGAPSPIDVALLMSREAVPQNKLDRRVRPRAPVLAPTATDILKIVGDGVISTDAKGRILNFNRAAEEMFGYAESEVLGKPVEVLMPSRFRTTHASEVHLFARGLGMGAHRMGHQRAVFGRRSNGEEFPLEATLSYATVQGAAVLTAVVRDVSERRRGEALLAERSRKLAEAEQRLRLSLEVGQIGSWQWHVDTDRFEVDAIARRLFGLSPVTPLTFADLERAGLAPLTGALCRAASGEGGFDLEMSVIGCDGNLRWSLVKGAVFADEAGRVLTVTGVISDATERHDAEEQRRLVLFELNHRMKNMLTLVNSIISMGGEPGTSLEEFKSSLRQRVGAIAETHRLLLERDWTCATVDELVQAEMAAYSYPEDRRVHACGPLLALDPGNAIALGLVLHELATNAVKYGALGLAGGSVTLRWHVAFPQGRREMVFEWAEQGGPPVLKPTRRGFGSTLIERMMTLRGARVSLDYDPVGLRCRIDLPIDDDRSDDRALPQSHQSCP